MECRDKSAGDIAYREAVVEAQRQFISGFFSETPS